ncbi:MAG TPA: DUF2148 domain-containing protein [Verrucomicrobiae bacterium]|nr:DUF2148 domain-containing protein [Verrucomicrobiae bacterium]
MKKSAELEREAALQVVALMAAAARTAPKTRGIDNIKVIAMESAPAKKKLIAKMKEIARAENRPSIERDANNIANSPALLAIGVESNTAGLNCGFCGQPTCEAQEAVGGVCAFNSIDLGIAACSAAAVANQFHVDNRVMYSIGRACLDLRLFDNKVKQAIGIPLSVTGKNPFFDRKP